MKFIYGINNFKKFNIKKCALAIGNFDGVHLGHQYLFKILYKEAKKRNLPIIVIIFEPYPLEFFYGKKYSFRLTSLREKLCYLSNNKVDYVICIKFDLYISKMIPEHFISIIIKKLKFKLIIIGKDFRFGINKKGNLSLLKKEGKKYNFQIIKINNFYINKIRVSSTLIRKMILKNNFSLANIFLGHSYTISGKVIYGNSIGRNIGFPTANISLYNNTTLLRGVFAIYANGIIKNKKFLGIANIGINPTFSRNIKQCEVYIFNFNKNLYGKYLNIEILKKIREEKKFYSIQSLKKQINKDVETVKKFFLHKHNMEYKNL